MPLLSLFSPSFHVLSIYKCGRIRYNADNNDIWEVYTMYNVSIPVMIDSPTFDTDAILRDLKLAGSNRLFIALPPFTTHLEHFTGIFEKLEKAIRFFQGQGVEVGVWYWTFMVSGQNDCTSITGLTGKIQPEEKCPLDENFLQFALDNTARIAAMKPDFILFDDDLRLMFVECGCVCKHHREAIKAYLHANTPEGCDAHEYDAVLDEEPSTGNLSRVMFNGKPNRLRSAFLHENGESLKMFCRKMRETVDKYDPTIRFGICSCMSVWDADGVDSFTLAKILAGSTKPFLRLICAPYWGVMGFWGMRYADTIEMHRMERSWYDGCDVEVISEGDVYPRPRFRIPAASLEIFDTALRADGILDGIHKYMFDYTSSQNYERGYLNKHLANAEIYKDIARIFDGKTHRGVRIYNAMNKIEDADFTGRDIPPGPLLHLVYSRAARMLAANAVPSVYYDTDIADCGIVFGENARHLPKSAFEKPLVLDLTAARILTEKGYDVGIEEIGEKLDPWGYQREHFPTLDDEYVQLSGGASGLSHDLLLKEGAVVHSELVGYHDRKPLCFTYSSKDGNFIVYNFRTYEEDADESFWRNYCRVKQLHMLLADFGVKLPYTIYGNPDLYTLCKEDEKELSIGLWNCHADYISDGVITLADNYMDAEFIGCTGRLEGNVITIDKIPAYEFGFVKLVK